VQRLLDSFTVTKVAVMSDKMVSIRCCATELPLATLQKFANKSGAKYKARDSRDDIFERLCKHLGTRDIGFDVCMRVDGIATVSGSASVRDGDAAVAASSGGEVVASMESDEPSLDGAHLQEIVDSIDDLRNTVLSYFKIVSVLRSFTVLVTKSVFQMSETVARLDIIETRSSSGHLSDGRVELTMDAKWCPKRK
jgi:hypothetical protein